MVSGPTGDETSPAGAVGKLVVLVDSFPELSQTFIGSELRALARAAWAARVEAGQRAVRPDVAAEREFPAHYRQDDREGERLRALAWLLARHPLRCATDLLARRRWRREEPVPPLRLLAPAARRIARSGEPHLHAHFAAGAALSALRLSRLTDRRYSVTAHAYDIFLEPRNLREKLERAAFVTTGCRYNVEHLSTLAPGARVTEIVMGVDGEQFARTVPYPGSRVVLAVGRLVEKKGFGHLIDAVAQLQGTAPVDRLDIVGEGPLGPELRGRVTRLGLESKVRFLGALAHDAVRAAMERADLLVMPCVIAADGDRDSMPVVVKEALALEVPVVGSDEVGLPELIEPGWGRLVPPGDPRALALAIEELLDLAPEQRAQMGRAGRTHVLEYANAGREGARLARLIADHNTSIR